MGGLRSLIVFATIAAIIVAAYPQQPANPVVGIITHPLSQCEPPPAGVVTNACVESYYVRWLEQSGIRVVAIPFNATFEKQKWFLERVNGVLFQGGGLGGAEMEWYIGMASKIVSYGFDRNAAGDPFVIWGTCQGFQVIAAVIAGNMSVIEGTYHGMYPLMMPLNFTSAQKTSRLFGDDVCPKDVLQILAKKNSTLNWHHDIVKPSTWDKYPEMQLLLSPLSTNNVPGSNTVFVSAYESPISELYATQFHPERPPYCFTDDGVGHTADDIKVSTYLSNFIFSRVIMNNHTFDTPMQFEANRIAHWPLLDSGWGRRTYYVQDINE